MASRKENQLKRDTILRLYGGGKKRKKARPAARKTGENAANPFSSEDSGFLPASGPPAHPPGRKTLVAAPTRADVSKTAANGGIAAVLAERGRTYGPNPFNQETVAMGWQAILESHFQTKLPGPIPPHIVALMMCTLKILRWSCPFEYNPDNKVDLLGYAEIAERCEARITSSPENGPSQGKILMLAETI